MHTGISLRLPCLLSRSRLRRPRAREQSVEALLRRITKGKRAARGAPYSAQKQFDLCAEPIVVPRPSSVIASVRGARSFSTCNGADSRRPTSPVRPRPDLK